MKNETDKLRPSGLTGIDGLANGFILCYCGSPKMQPLNPPDSHHLSAALGWLGLGNWQEANEELDKIAPALGTHQTVLEARYQVCAKAQNWNKAAQTAYALVLADSQKADYWIWHAYATRRMSGGGIFQARRILAQAQAMFALDPIVSFNLACYECQLGNFKQAWNWLNNAIKHGDPSQIKLMALNDSDLEPLREKIAEL